MNRFSFPEKLGDIVRQNKEELMLSYLPKSSLAHICCDEFSGTYRGEISTSRIIAFEWCVGTYKEQREFCALGYCFKKKIPHVTSQIVGISDDLSLIQTKSGSIYRIPEHLVGEPDSDLLKHLCRKMHLWGLGRYFGVPEMF